MDETTETEPKKTEITLILAYVGLFLIMVPLAISIFTTLNINILFGNTVIILGFILILPRFWVKRNELEAAGQQAKKAFWGKSEPKKEKDRE